MLNLPETGFNRSVGKNNFNMNLLCDWIEFNLLFSEDQISQSDIVDIFIENQLVDDSSDDDSDEQDIAYQIISDAWSILKERYNKVGNLLDISLSSTRISRKKEWQEYPVYAFCLMQSLKCYLYPKWVSINLNHTWEKANIPTTVPETGALFELIAYESVTKMFNGWHVEKIGWSANNTIPLVNDINRITKLLDEVEGAERTSLLDAYVKEMGLDLLAYYSFNDLNAAKPVFMFQCASGKNWDKKLHTPDLHTWKRIISFSCEPVKGFIMPFSFKDVQEFRKKTISVNGLFLDRYRLLRPTNDLANFFSSEVNEHAKHWIEPQVAAILKGLEI